MKRLLRIYRRYCAVAIMLVLLLIAMNVLGFLALSWYNLERSGENTPSKITFRSVSDDLVEKTGGEYSLSAVGEMYLKENEAAFLMLLDKETGEILYSWQLPGQLNHTYDLGEVASFTRWYLDDYPVKVWNTEEGLLVVGNQIDSVIQFSIAYSKTQMETLLQWIPIGLGLNLAVVLLVILVLGQKFNRSLAPIDSGIEQLSKGEKLSVQGRGLIKELADNLNQASDILQEQRERINRRDTARTEWIAGVSHDIRTPLSMIMGYAESMENSPNLSEKEKQQILVIKNQSIRIRRLIEDLNLTSKLSYQMQPLRLDIYRPAALLRQVVTEVLNQEIKEGDTIELELEPGLERYERKGDVQLLKRAVENLVNNSMRHNPPGCHVKVKSWVYEERIVISVLDDGCGIPSEVRRALMLEEQPSREIHIMGLRIAKQITEAHKGVFSISDDGKEVQMRL